MKDNYSIFKKFAVLEQAKELEKLLQNNNIDTIIADNVPSVDSNFGANPLNNEIEIRIKQSDFKKASEILNAHVETIIDNIDEDYYLNSFTDDELYDILLKSDEWSEFDYNLSKKLLKERGKPVDNGLLKSLKLKRLKELAKPDGNQKGWIIAGYIFAFLGGFLGLIIGYFLWTSKKTLPNGQKVYSYYPKDRKNGKYIFYISLIIFPISFLIKILGKII